MEHVEAVADEVDSWTQRDVSEYVLRLRGRRQLIARRNDPRFTVWVKAMALQQEKHWPVYVEFDPRTDAIQLLLLCTPREVKSVMAEATGDVTVVFRLAPSFYVLKKARQDYDSVLALLTAAAKTGAPLLIAVHPTTLEILCARPSKN